MLGEARKGQSPGGFGSLAQQGSLTPFTGRDHRSQVKGADSKKGQCHFFDTLEEQRLERNLIYAEPVL